MTLINWWEGKLLSLWNFFEGLYFSTDNKHLRVLITLGLMVSSITWIGILAVPVVALGGALCLLVAWLLGSWTIVAVVFAILYAVMYLEQLD